MYDNFICSRKNPYPYRDHFQGVPEMISWYAPLYEEIPLWCAIVICRSWWLGSSLLITSMVFIIINALWIYEKNVYSIIHYWNRAQCATSRWKIIWVLIQKGGKVWLNVQFLSLDMLRKSCLICTNHVIFEFRTRFLLFTIKMICTNEANLW